MTAASTPPSSIRTMASSGVKAVTCRCERLLGKPLPQRWIWASTVCIASSRIFSPSPEALGQRLGHIEPRMAGWLTFDPGGDLPTLLQIETRRLKVQRRQYRAGAAAAPPFFLCHSEDSTTKSLAP